MRHEQQGAGGERSAIIVAGMHRSGTSATTRIINLLGATLARDLIPAGIGNERGHWESRAVQDLNNAMLSELGSDLYSPVNFPADWFGSSEAQRWIGHMRDLITNEYPTSRLFVVKDPRITLFLPLWSEAMRQSSIMPLFVLPFRHPETVATSLEARERKLDIDNPLPHAQGLAVWLRYVLAAEKFTRGQPRTFVAFEKMLANWRDEFTRMGRQLGIDWPNEQCAGAKIDDFLESEASVDASRLALDQVSGIYHDVYSSLTQAVLEPQSVLPAFNAAGQAVATAEGLLGPALFARDQAFIELRERAHSAAKRHDSERTEMHGRFAAEIELRDSRNAEATGHARQLQATLETLERDRSTAVDYAKSLELDRTRAVEISARQERERVDTQARFAAELALRNTRLNEAAIHVREMERSVELLTREHGNAAEYAKLLEQDRNRAVDYASSLKASRDEALEYAQTLELARNAETQQRRAALFSTIGSPVFFTIASRNYLAYALTLMRSVAEHYPDAPRYLILADRDDGDAALIDAPFVTIPAEALDLPDFDAFAFRYSIMEFNTAIKPYAFAYLRRQHADAGVIYLDPDILLVEPLTEVESAFAQGALAILTPHLVDPVDDDRTPGERDILSSGTYNCGFIAIGAHAEADRLIAWWADRLEFGALSDIEAGLFTDQKWVDLVPGLFPDVLILRDQGYNLAYWNLSQRTVSRHGLHWYAGKQRLAFVHFSGVDLDHPENFSKHQNRHSQATIGSLRPLYEHYLSCLAANGHAEHRAKPYAFGRFIDGEPICDPVRVVYRRYFDKGTEQPQSDPFSMDRHLYDLPCEEQASRVEAPITRLMYAVWKMRSDLQQAFDLGQDEGRRGYIRWFARAAQAEMGIPQRHLDSLHRALEVSHVEAARNSAIEPVSPAPGLLHRAASLSLDVINWSCRFRLALYFYAAIPERTRSRVRSQLERIAARSGADAPVSIRHNETGINLVGYAHGEFGVAEILRRHAYALQGGGVPFVVIDFDTGVASRQDDRSMQRYLSQKCRYSVNVFCINADQMLIAHRQLGDEVFAGRYNIGCWFWELEKFPDQWQDAIEIVDEIWVTSPFVRNAIAACTDKPVHIVPVALGVDLPEQFSRSQFGLSEGVFLCLFSFDFNSFFTRKNPEGAIAAFRKAFADGRRDVRLLIKTSNGKRFPEALKYLVDVAAEDDRIEVRDGFLDRSEMWALQACCDCYLSLHRSEGLGLGMAECMLLGKPVVATAYSGNLAFMDVKNSCLVDYSLIPVKEGEYPAWQDQHWAEPDLDQAAAYLIRLADEPAYERQIGQAAKASVVQQLSPAASVAAMTARLTEIRAQRPR
ncbi:MAG: glycosyltransferase [Dokdonella sp.]